MTAMTAMRRRAPAFGFSLVELLAAAAIMGVLASVAVPFIETAVRRQKEQALRTALRDIRQALDAYKQAVRDQRIKVADADKDKSGYPPDLAVLAGGVTDELDKKRVLYFLRRIPRDPFSTDTGATATAINSWGLRSYASSDASPQAGEDVFDVYSKSTQTGLNGVPYREW